MFEINLTKKQIMRLIAILQVVVAGIDYYIDRPNPDLTSTIIYLGIGLLFLGISFSKHLTSGKTVKQADMTKNQKLEQKLELLTLGLTLLLIITNISDIDSELFCIDSSLIYLLILPMPDKSTKN
ncbi:hypothetical protein PT287_00440 [Lactobacillus sp. ESL0679]|uniref:hypothetical protein n=1 Tax=Lactobacillus sp. ESL0679 TaxID=2983209 RepID=UPI0023F910AB|nr:hypothetical protein [Lactobacillus sp. ESL0679]MDF7681989.1 hypothetical protein [Lactobacillus sp. ESL0679]